MGLQEPLPDFVSVINEAKWWGVSPMEILEWPLEWITNGRIVREAESIAQQSVKQVR